MVIISTNVDAFLFVMCIFLCKVFVMKYICHHILYG